MIYTPTTSSTPTYGQQGDSVSALQTQLNAQNAGKTGWVPLVVDGKYGDMTKAGASFTGTPTRPALITTSGAARANNASSLLEHDQNMATLTASDRPLTDADGNAVDTSDPGSPNYKDATTQALDRIAATSDAASKSMIATINAQRANSKNALTAKYDNYKSGLQLLGIQHNEAQFSPDLLAGHQLQADNDLNQKLSDIDVKTNKALMDNETAKANRDYKSIAERNAYIKILKSQRNEAIKSYAEQLNAQKTIASDVAESMYKQLSSLPDGDKEAYVQALSTKYGISPDSITNALVKEHATQAGYSKKIAGGGSGKGGSGGKVTVATGIKALTPQFQKIADADGHVDATKWLAGRTKWMSQGLSASTYNSNFKQFLTPSDYTKAGFAAPKKQQ